MPMSKTTTKKKNANNAKQSTLLAFFGPNKTTTKPIVVATPPSKILSKTLKTPPTESTLEEDVDDTSPPPVLLSPPPVAAATTTKTASPKKITPSQKKATSTKPSTKRLSQKKPSVTHKQKKRRVIIDDSEEEEWSDDDDDDASMEEDDEFNATPDKDVNKKTTTTASKKPPAATSATKKPSGWGFLNGSFKATPSSSSKKTTAPKNKRSSNASPTQHKYVKQPYSDGDDLPILVHPQDFFDDMVLNQLCENGTRTDLLQPLLETMHGRTLKIATMCSGTESPVLALDMIAKAMEDVAQTHNLKVGENDEAPLVLLEHVFSCEIEPFKQSYIERNFQPKRLFRDIRELGNDTACTAFGSMIPVPNSPGCVDLLVAGTSCVDFSNLNNSKKSLTDEGESGQTFAGMLKWIQKAQPAIVILENVFGAPWDHMVQLMEHNGYAATYRCMGTKNYYIPHTRQRGYLVAYTYLNKGKDAGSASTCCCDPAAIYAHE